MSKELKPQIRFKGFEDDWVKEKLGDFTSSYSGGTPTSSRKEYYGGNIPFIRSGEIHGNSTELFITQKGYQESSAALVKKGDILYALYGATSGEVNISQIDGAINQAILAIIPDVNHNALFLKYWLIKNKNNITATYLQGGQGNLSASIVKNIMVDQTSLDEQNKIGKYISAIDFLINNTSREIGRLETMKQASLQKMFPRPGITTPEIRFSGFTDPWKVGKLSDILEIDDTRNSDNKYNREDVLSVSGYYGLVNQIEFQGRSFAGASLLGYKITKPGQVIYTKSPLKAQPFGIVKSNQYGIGIISPLYAVYNPKEDNVADFVHYYFAPVAKLNNYLRPLINKGAKNTILISDETAIDGEIVYPSGKEQKFIADYFIKLDKLLVSKRQKLAKLRQIKQACLNKMFIN